MTYEVGVDLKAPLQGLVEASNCHAGSEIRPDPICRSAMTVHRQSRRDGGFTEAAFEAFLRERDEPAWLVDRRREAFARFQAFAWPERARRRMAADRHPRPSSSTPSRLPTSRAAAAPTDRAALDAALDSARARTTPPGIAHVDGALVARRPTRRRLGGAVFVDLDRAVKDHPELLERYLLTEAVTPARRRLRRPARRVLDRRNAALRAQGRDGRGAAVQPGRAGARAAVDLGHTLVVLEEGAEATLVRETAGRGRARRPGCTSGRSRSSSGRGARLRYVNIQNWDDATWHFSRERAIVGRDASLQWTVGGLGLAAGQGQPGSRPRGRGPRPRSTA